MDGVARTQHSELGREAIQVQTDAFEVVVRGQSRQSRSKIQEHFNDFADTWINGAVDHYPEVVDGYFALPERAGLGVTLREDSVGEHPREQVFFNLIRGRLAQAPKENK
jgi:L-alanine-DL-glutamate epimerase-like enolase superfamily enzyme